MCHRHRVDRARRLVVHSRILCGVYGVSGLGAVLASIAQPAFAQGNADVTPPSVVTHVDAVYPRSALREGKHADVVLAVTVDADGHVSKVDVLESGGDDLDEAAVIAARQWTFVPAMRGGQPVASRIRIPFHFAPPAAPPEIVPSPEAPGGVQGTGSAEPAVPTRPTTSKPARGPTVLVYGRPNPPARGTSDFRIDRTTLAAAPHASAADLLATAPGFYIAHPEGEAVAQRVYLRGFDADHGQDVEFKVSGIPLNQPSHLHGQGYADLNLIIPETVRSLRVLEGVYDPHQGDFAVAGSVDYDLGVEERGAQLKLSYGSFDTKRVLALWAPKGQAEETFGAATFRKTDGFGNGTRGGISGSFLGQYRLALSQHDSLLFHAAGYGARANIAGVLRRDDIDAQRVDFYDAYPDPSARAQSAGTSRSQVGVSFEHASDDGARVSAQAWAAIVSYRSRMNFTGYTERSEVNPQWVGFGDLIEQSNNDRALGALVSYRSSRATLLSWLAGHYELGAEFRNHSISQTQNLLKPPQNETWDQRDDAKVRMSDVGLYLDGQLSAGKHLRLRGGARADLLFFDVDDRLGNFIPAAGIKSHIVGFRRTATGVVYGPRATLEADPASWLRLSASYGEGYRSPQARQLEEGEQAPFAKVRSYELGATLKEGQQGSLTFAAYQTKLSYDLAFHAEEGRLERIGPTTRRGLVGYALLNPASFLHVGLSATYVHATLDSPPVPTPENPNPPYVSGQSLPYVPPLVVRTDLGAKGSLGKLAGRELQWRAGYGTTFLSSRPLPYGHSSPPVFLVDVLAGLRRDWLELSIDVTNLLGVTYADTEYAFVSYWRTTAVPSRLPARHITAGAPRALFANLTVHL
jgi:iron complex outermembrane recepter protein